MAFVVIVVLDNTFMVFDVVQYNKSADWPEETLVSSCEHIQHTMASVRLML